MSKELPNVLVSQPEVDRAHEEALQVNEELDAVLAEGKYTKVQETADTIVRKRELLKTFQEEIARVSRELPEGKKPTLSLNEKGIANMYMANHLFGKDFTMEHIAECLVRGEEVTDQMKHSADGSRYFKLDIPHGAGMPGRFVLPQESGTTLGEHVANWNQSCEFKFRHGRLAPVIKKKDLPQWLINHESVFYVIVEKNEMPDGKLQVADGPSEDDPEGSWLVSTVHYGQPSRIKPRPPKEPKWESLKKDSNALMDSMVQFQKTQSKYLKEYAEWSDEQTRVVFVDLDEEGVGQKGVKEQFEMQESVHEDGPIDPKVIRQVAELKNDNAAFMKMVMEMKGAITQLSSEVKGLKTKQGGRS